MQHHRAVLAGVVQVSGALPVSRQPGALPYYETRGPCVPPVCPCATATTCSEGLGIGANLGPGLCPT